MIHLIKGQENEVAVTLREKQLGDTTTYTFRLFRDGEGYVDPEADDYDEDDNVMEEVLVDASPDPGRYQLFTIDMTTSELKQGYYTYVFTEAVDQYTTNMCETGRCWIQDLTDTSSVYE